MNQLLLLTRSIPLARSTRDAWRNNNVRIVSRSKLNNRAFPETVKRFGATGIINLGNLDLDFSSINTPVFNNRDSIRAVSSPLSLRKTLPDFIPPRDVRGPHWHKSGGYGGRGKELHVKDLGACALLGGDVQAHVVGDEYRVVTVGERVVQASLKHGEVGNFDYEWVGVKGVQKNGIIPFLKEAVAHVPSGGFTVFGWDIIVGKDGPVILECNTSPGVNVATASRIVTEIERIL